MPCRLVISLLASGEELRATALKRLASQLGPVVLYSEPLAFPGAAFYAPEMGPGLNRRVAAFAGPRLPGDLAPVKRLCLDLEAELAKEGRRTVNLDPGLLSKNTLVLATRKYNDHRMELAPGIFGEVALHYRRGSYQGLPWTYPDYAHGELNELLGQMRPRLLWSFEQERGQGEQA
ncbi:MAG: DUF4416 family protein [Desulfarculaceae bacterium]|nr:DUF4416 family protein [Desulfarculaceae bacterium]MCF8072266.1 DUF4416 family protein [Desulfarculaceae bacterium]MCF8100187.1 DUF4416 family protein [Desulfarculaceae bacterium]MCF8117869.1 DUF4416 family protein [Desulfarculaceae bacterium]